MNDIATADHDLLLSVIGQYRNGWLPQFGHASHHLAKAVAEGRINAVDLTAVVNLINKPVRGSATIRRVFAELPVGTDREGVDLSAEAIIGLSKGHIGRDVQPWYLADDDSVTDAEIVRLVEYSSTLTIKEAAQVLLDSDEYFKVHGYRRS